MNSNSQVLFDAASFANYPTSRSLGGDGKSRESCSDPCALAGAYRQLESRRETRETDEVAIALKATRSSSITAHVWCDRKIDWWRQSALRHGGHRHADAVLVAHKDSSQQVKDIVAKLKRDGHITAKSI